MGAQQQGPAFGRTEKRAARPACPAPLRRQGGVGPAPLTLWTCHLFDCPGKLCPGSEIPMRPGERAFLSALHPSEFLLV